jgi:DeoR/GlpR family transcriptional regulator of sugar metabolism
MYQIKLNKEDSKRLKKIIRQIMIKDELTVSDLSRMTGYSVQTIYNYLSNNDRLGKFVAAALCDVLNITVGDKQ